MTTKNRRELEELDEQEVEIKVPLRFTNKEIMVIIGVIVSIITTWGAFQTKLNIMERLEQVRDEQIRELRQEIKDLRERIRVLELNQSNRQQNQTTR